MAVTLISLVSRKARGPLLEVDFLCALLMRVNVACCELKLPCSHECPDLCKEEVQPR